MVDRGTDVIRCVTAGSKDVPYRVLDVPFLGVVCDVLIELALQVFLLLLIELVLLVQAAVVSSVQP